MVLALYLLIIVLPKHVSRIADLQQQIDDLGKDVEEIWNLLEEDDWEEEEAGQQENVPLPVFRETIGPSIHPDRARAIQFIGRAMEPYGPGLAISKWKTMERWAQSDVEEMLDYFADLEIITPRQNGIACQWIGEISIGQIVRRMDASPTPPPRTPLQEPVR